MTQDTSLANQCSWEVLEEDNHSDHQYLKIHLQTKPIPTPISDSKQRLEATLVSLRISDIIVTFIRLRWSRLNKNKIWTKQQKNCRKLFLILASTHIKSKE
ncbi:hypothetical protein AVEN_69019-1 [Araneus ventricosus]|uniref:Endonuclease/exonuclease/phosphatase domain-containing protein n=1 Tax=Araneus ventricosus TaxID=182803 RepID=A0A4Y2KXD5_ARAVE|nr:hypothetical protein AVEN_69019-1 [Araneus ventricosus]